MEKSVCALCRTTGQYGAQWIAKVDNEDLRVHRPCGDRLAKTAPEGTEVKIFPSPELREIFREKAREREVQAFWKEKFAAARAQQR